MTLQLTVGTVNYTDWLHVTAAKVSDPGTILWEDWFDVPVTNLNFVIPNLDADIYYITFYDAPTDTDLGTLAHQCEISALSPEFAYEIKFYEMGNLPAGASVDVTEKILNDPYLINKTIESVFKEQFRFLEPDVDHQFDNTTGDITLLIPANFETGEKFIVTIKYSVGATASSAGGLYSGTLTVTDSTKTLIASDRNKRVRCAGTIATQAITLCALSAINVEDGFYFDNTCGGTAMQVKILLPGTDRIKFNGFIAASDLFAEFWVSKGEHLLLRKFNSSYWEVITDYKGIHVGERYGAGYVGMPGTIPEDATLYDGDEYPRVWWWINNILPSSHVITDDAVTGAYTHPAARAGQFVKHSTLKKFRTPNTQSMVDKGLLNFDSYGADGSRLYDYPGGKQDQALMDHFHPIGNETGGNTDPNISKYRRDTAKQVRQVPTALSSVFSASTDLVWTGANGVNAGAYNIVNNVGVVNVRRI